MKWYDLKCIQWIMQRNPDSNNFKHVKLFSNCFAKCFQTVFKPLLCLILDILSATFLHRKPFTSAPGTRPQWWQWWQWWQSVTGWRFSHQFTTFHHMFSANFSRFQVQISVSSSGFKWVPRWFPRWVLRVSSEVCSEWLGVALQRPLTKASMFPFNFLGKTTFWMPFCTWFPQVPTASATAPRWTRFLGPRFQGPPVVDGGRWRRAPWSRSAWAWRTRRAGAQSRAQRLKSPGTTSPPDVRISTWDMVGVH